MPNTLAVPSFEQVMEFTSRVSAPAAFEDADCRAYYDALVTLPPASTIVEVGVEYGRSTSIAAQIARWRQHRLLCIDPFVDPKSRLCFVEMMAMTECPYRLYVMKTEEVMETELPPVVDLLLVDGDHTEEGITCDMRRLLPRMRKEGIACFHDYGRDSLPEVYPNVNKFLYGSEWSWKWEEVTTSGTLHVARRLA